MRFALALLALLALLPLAAAVPTDVVPYEALGWSFQEVASGAGDGFQSPSFDASGWAIGQGAFATSSNFCFGPNLPPGHTLWTGGTDMLARRDIFLPAGTTSVVIRAAIDNDITIWWNGVQLVHQTSGGCPFQDMYEFSVLDGDLLEQNVLAIRGHDAGPPAYMDVRASAELPAPSVPTPELGTIVLMGAGLAVVGLVVVSRRAR